MFKHSLIALAALGAGLIGFSASEASAFTASQSTPAMVAAGNPLLVEVRDHNRNGMRRKGDWNNNNNHQNYRYDRRRHGDRCNSWNNRCRHYHNGYYYANPWWVLPLVGAGIALSNRGDYYDGGYGNGHVEWCMNRYRSYNVRTNTWVSYSGRVNQCISPYSR